jgi:hypothetical protein
MLSWYSAFAIAPTLTGNFRRISWFNSRLFWAIRRENSVTFIAFVNQACFYRSVYHRSYTHFPIPGGKAVPIPLFYAIGAKPFSGNSGTLK